MKTKRDMHHRNRNKKKGLRIADAGNNDVVVVKTYALHPIVLQQRS